MILKASQRGGAKQLALHLLRTDENEHAEVHEVRGFITDDIVEAFKEVQAISKGTKCKQPFFSVSLNPPETEIVGIAAFEAAVAQIEERHDLQGHPRVIVFHEKEGRRHAHAVWSRIDTQTMTARNLAHFKLKLRDISRALFFEHGWRMPRGLINSAARDPRNFTLAEWQQSKRIGVSARDIKQMVQECWAASDSRKAFVHALSERGFILARGDRRDFVLVSCEGEMLGLRTQLGKRTKDLRDKLGDAGKLPSVTEAKLQIATDMTQALGRHMRDTRKVLAQKRVDLETRRTKMTEAHRQEREALDAEQQARETEAARARAARLRGGLPGIWQFITGARARIKRENEQGAISAMIADRAQREALIVAQLQVRQTLQIEIRAERRAYVETVLLLRSDRCRLRDLQHRAVSDEQTKPSPSVETEAGSATSKRPRRSRRSKRLPRGKRGGPKLEM